LICYVNTDSLLLLCFDPKIAKNEKLYTGKQRNNPTQPKKEIIFLTVLFQVFKCVQNFTDNVFNQESLKDLPGLKNEN
jgi:hypothetical protein